MMCFNRNILIGLGVIALGVFAFAPGAIGAALPVLILLACPLSMVAMMAMMRSGRVDPVSPSRPSPAESPQDARDAEARTGS